MTDLSPVFVIGSYRSGTSIFAWCLGQHANIVNLPETNWIYRYALNVERLYSMGTCNGRHSHLTQLDITKDEFYEEMGCCVSNLVMKTVYRLDGFELDVDSVNDTGFRRRLNEADPKTRWVDATPENSHYVYGLSKMFPGAKFIHLLRNPEDVAKSLLKFSNAGGTDYSEADAYKTWYRLVNASFESERALGSNTILRVLYSDLIDSPERTLSRCLEFLGEQYDGRCLAPLQKRINSSNIDHEAPSKAVMSWPSTKEIKRKSNKLYDDLVSSIGDSVESDEEYLKIIKSHHQYVSQNE